MQELNPVEKAPAPENPLAMLRLQFGAIAEKKEEEVAPVEPTPKPVLTLLPLMPLVQVG